MAEVIGNQGPIFIGGTGRSGTSIMADLLNSHPDIVLPAHENKLIVEKDGLRDLVAQLGGRSDMKGRHYAVAGFVRWAQKLRSLGFRDPRLREQVEALMSDRNIDFQRACDLVARNHPDAYLSLHAIGHGFGLAHYDACLNAFLSRICGTVITKGIVDTEGLISPFILPSPTSREAMLNEARSLLDSLYSLPLRQHSAVRWCDDTPNNWLYLDFLFELYPNMKFIHMIRDPRDVVASYMKQVWAPAEPTPIIAMFRAQFDDYEALRTAIPVDRILELRIEDISRDRSPALEMLSQFLGVRNAFNADLFHDDKVNTGHYADALGSETISAVETQLADWMLRQGYLG